jgi:hypothetical protein
MRPLENYDCDTLTIVAAARHAFLPELNPFNFEVGTFSIDFDYDHGQLTEVEQINDNNLRGWKDFNYLFELQPDSDYHTFLEKNFGLKYIKRKVKTLEEFLGEVEKYLEADCPVIACCNAYHLFYTEYYQTVPGGMFQAYHHIVVYGISRDDNQVWIYDPTLENFNGVIPFNEFINALQDERGVEDFEGLVYCTIGYNGKESEDINRELLLWALEYYVNTKGTRIKEKLLQFLDDYIHYYNYFTSEDFKNKLLEFGFFFFRGLATRRSCWWDFLDYYKNLEDIDHIQEEIDAFKTNNEKILNIGNLLYANALKEKKKLDLERLKNKTEQLMNEENRIFGRLHEKIF